VAVSQATRDELVALGVHADRISVVHNGTEAVPETGVARDTEPRVVVLGRLVPHKRVEHVLRALASLRDRHPGLTVSVVGDGWWSAQLRRAAVDLGVADRVEFLGFVDEERKHEELARAWVLALPSLKEGWGLVVMEAAAHGVPTVAYRDAGGVAESVVDGETGLLVDGDAEDFAAALDGLLADPDRATRLGAAAEARAGEFSWTATAEQFAAVLQEALAAGPDPRRRIAGRIPVGRAPQAHVRHPGAAPSRDAAV
jgi:glycosyltransferase involved in cell wall biosynthesis